ncbi:hypothetical protein [Streptomyces sp. NPDC057675]|uniref:hypothetical protein n=1 Tax=Streptomyces sp. NPDC057675 TaxID=3346204 RepID=UPI003693DC2E
MTSRHPVTVWWEEIARVLRPGGTYFSQQVGPASVFEVANSSWTRRASFSYPIRPIRSAWKLRAACPMPPM